MRDVGPTQKIPMAIRVPDHQEVVPLKATSDIEAELKRPHAKAGAGNQSRHRGHDRQHLPPNGHWMKPDGQKVLEQKRELLDPLEGRENPQRNSLNRNPEIVLSLQGRQRAHGKVTMSYNERGASKTC